MDSSLTMRERLRRHRRKKFWRLLRLLCLMVLTGVSCIYGWRYLHSPALAFGSVSIHGSSMINEKDVIALAGCGDGPLNLFNASLSRLREALAHDVRFKNTEVAYRFPATVQVIVEEREPAMYVANSYHSYLKLDYNGMVINVTTAVDAKAPVLVGEKCGNIYIGDVIANQNIMAVLKFLQLLTPEARKRISEIAIDDKQNVKLRLTGSLLVILGNIQELAPKAPVFMTVFAEIKDKEIKAEYIDLTFAKPYIKLLPGWQKQKDS